MGILSYLRKKGFPWLGSWGAGPARSQLEHERVAIRTVAAGKAWFLPYLDSQTGETAAIRAEYRKMLKEPSIKAALLDKILSVAALDLSTNPGGETQRDKDAADFSLHLLNRLTGGDYGMVGLPAFVETVILPGLIDGYSITEKVWHPETRGKWAGKVLLTLKNKDPDKQVQLEVDEFNNIVSLRGLGPNSGEEYDPANFVLWRHLSIFDNPAGMSDLRAAYRAHWMMDTTWKLRSIYLTKFSAGPMLAGTYTDPGAQKSQLEDALENAKANTWYAIPEGAKVEAIDLASRGTADFKACIDDLKHEVFLGISGAILQSLEGSTTEGRGSSAIHKSTADVRKWHIRACVESVINSQILPDAIDLNFAGVAIPTVALGGIDDGEMASSLAIDVGLMRDLRLPLSLKDLYKRYGRPEPTEPGDILKPADAAQPQAPAFPFSAQPPAAVPSEPSATAPAAAPQQVAKESITDALADRRARLREKFGDQAADAALQTLQRLLGNGVQKHSEQPTVIVRPQINVAPVTVNPAPVTVNPPSVNITMPEPAPRKMVREITRDANDPLKRTTRIVDQEE